MICMDKDEWRVETKKHKKNRKKTEKNVAIINTPCYNVYRRFWKTKGILCVFPGFYSQNEKAL